MRRTLVALLAAVLGSAAQAAPSTATAPAKAPATAPVVVKKPPPAVPPPQDHRKQNIENQKRAIGQIGALQTTYKLSELMTFALRDGAVVVNWTGSVMSEKPVRVNIADSSATWIVQRAVIQNIGMGPGMPQVQLQRFDFSREGDAGPWVITMNMGPNYANISAQWPQGSSLHNVSFSQSGNQQAFLSVMGWRDNRVNQLLNINAPNLGEMLRQRPEEVREYLGPVLRDLTGVNWLRPGPTELYRVFDRLQPDAKTAARVTELLPALDSAVFAEREAAGKQLESLGRPGLLAAMRLDDASLSAEQKARLADLTAQYTHQPVSDLGAARTDIEFLVGALEDDEPAVRRAAKEAIERILGKAVDFDPATPPDKLAGAVRTVRQAIRAKSEAPASTQPARRGPIN